MIDWQAARDAYVRRFGVVHQFEKVTTPERELTIEETADPHALMDMKHTLRFFMLACWSGSGPITYASFGAVHGGAGNELFLTAVAPYPWLEIAVTELAEEMPRDVAPLSVVRHAVRLTSFDAMLVLPPEDGTFALGEVDGASRHALRLCPITGAERRLAVSDPGRLLALLRRAGALVADPLRACVVEPEQDDRRRANAARLLAEYQKETRDAAKRRDHLLQMNAPDIFIEHADQILLHKQAMLTHLEARVPAILGDAGAPELLEGEALGERFTVVLKRVLGSSVDPYRGLVPPRIAHVFRSFMFHVLMTHPVVYPILYSVVMGAGQRPANLDANGVHAAETFAEVTVSRLVRDLPAANEPSLAASGAAAAEGARRTFGAAGGLPWKVHAWASIVPALYLEAHDLGVAHGPALELALRGATALAGNVDTEPSLDSGPAKTRLAKIASAISKGLYRDYLGAVRETARGRAAL